MVYTCVKVVIEVDTSKESIVIAKPRRRWLKRVGYGLMGLLILALILLLLAIPVWAWWHNLVQQRLDEALAELDRTDPGWRLEEIESAREKIPEGENSARVVLAVARLLPKNWPSQEFEDLFAHLKPEVQLHQVEFERLEEALRTAQPALEEARKLANMPRGRHRIDYQPNPMDTLLNDQQDSRRVVKLLDYEALLQDQKKDLKAALVSCKESVNAARSVGDEPFAISQLIRIAGVISTCFSIERTLAQGEPPSEELADLQKLVENEDAFPSLVILARGERASVHGMYEAIENSDTPLTLLDRTQLGWENYAFGWFTRDKFREAHPTMLTVMSRFVAIAKLPLHKQLPAERNLDRELRKLKDSDPLAVLFIPALQKVSEAGRRKHAYLRCMMAALAAERYRRSQGTWPETLEKLRTKYLSAVPLDPFDGEPLRYSRLKDGLVIYSVGHDVFDNKGNFDREHPAQPGVDIGIRLWDVAKRRQPPHPKPREQEKLP